MGAFPSRCASRLEPDCETGALTCFRTTARCCGCIFDSCGFGAGVVEQPINNRTGRRKARTPTNQLHLIGFGVFIVLSPFVLNLDSFVVEEYSPRSLRASNRYAKYRIFNNPA